jgi:hypothetical protein
VHYELTTNVYLTTDNGSAEFLDIGCCRIEIPKEVRKKSASKRKRS